VAGKYCSEIEWSSCVRVCATGAVKSDSTMEEFCKDDTLAVESELETDAMAVGLRGGPRGANTGRDGVDGDGVERRGGSGQRGAVRGLVECEGGEVFEKGKEVSLNLT
jgi:hypothetical protein